MIRILQIVNIMDRAGIENMLMNYYRAIDRRKIQFDFLTHRPVEGAYDDEIRKLGGRVYYAPRLYPQNYKDYFEYMKVFFREHNEYRIVHSHIDSMSYLPLLAAKKSGIPVRIAHSHSTSIDFDFKWVLKQIYRNRITSVATNYAACSYKAGEFLFGEKKNVEIIYNALNINKFRYSEATRQKKRNELGLEGKFVIGHVGRFTKAKNHRFILETFRKIAEKRKEAFLLLVGTGELLAETKKQIERMGLTNKVKILSNRDDVNELYQVMDIFIFPSKYEGLGMGAVEAQISGLTVIASNNVPMEAKISDDFITLKLNSDVWVDKILNTASGERKTCYSDKYDIEITSKKLADYYEKLTKNITRTIKG